MGVKSAVFGVFHPGWFVSAVGVGLALQLLGWATGFGIAAGLTGYFFMGVLVGWASPGSTIVEPGIAAFFVATLGFVIDHLLLTLVGIGLVVGVGYGALGLLIGMAGGWLGEQL